MNRLFLGLPARFLTLSLISLALVTALLIWSGWRVLEHERLLSRQRQEQVLAGVADRITSGILRDLSRFESEMESMLRAEVDQGASELKVIGEGLAEDSVLLAFGPDSVESFPGSRLAYFPLVQESDGLGSEFSRADALEFAERNHKAAIQELKELVHSNEPQIRASALLRLARNYSKISRQEESRGALKELVALDSVRVETVPAGLLGRYFLCTLAEDPQQEAAFLYAELHRGAWKVDRATYQFYRQQLGELAGGRMGSLDPFPVILAEATEVAWSEWQISRERGGTLPKVTIQKVGDFSLLNVAIGMGDIGLCLIAGREQLERWLIDPMVPILEEFDLSLRLTDSQGNLAAGDGKDNWVLEYVAAPAETGLPWVFSLGATDPASLGDDYSNRRTTLVIGLTVVLAAVVLSILFVGRATAREMEAARLKSDFVSAVSHEFRTPLTSLRQFTEMLAENRVSEEEDRHRYYQVLKDETSRLGRLVENLLDFARIESNALEYHKEVIDLVDLLAELVSEFNEQVGRRGYSVRLTHSCQQLLVNVNREAIARAVWNLLDNAAKYSPGDETIEVNIEEREGEVVIRVVDRGWGISAREQKKIFEKFYRGPVAEGEGIKGTGLGLTMVRQIAEEHGGRIEVQSEEGKGSIFSIILPLIDYPWQEY